MIFQLKCLFIVSPKKLKLSTQSIGVSFISSWNLRICLWVMKNHHILINTTLICCVPFN